MDGPVLQTERLILRPTRAEDFEPWAAFMADEAATRFIGGAQPRATAWRGFLSMVAGKVGLSWCEVCGQRKGPLWLGTR